MNGKEPASVALRMAALSLPLDKLHPHALTTSIHLTSENSGFSIACLKSSVLH